MHFYILLSMMAVGLMATGVLVFWLEKRREKQNSTNNELLSRKFCESPDSSKYIDWNQAEQVRFPNLQRSSSHLSYDIFPCVQEKLQISQAELSDYTRIPESTLALRKEQGSFTETEWDRVRRFNDLFEFALEVLETEDNARQWLKTPKKVLGDEIPLDVAKTEAGARLVYDTLGKINFGVFA